MCWLISCQCVKVNYQCKFQIPDFAFRNLSTRKLFLKGNAITTIHANAFMGPLLDSLQVLDISDNKLRTVTQPGMPVLRNLHILNLCNNSIASLPPNAFLNYQSRFSLRELDLSANQLSRIPNHTFSGLEMLQTLAVTKNLLKIIPTDALKALPTLENLLLSVNEIKSIPANALPLPKLKSISFEANLVSIPKSLSQMLPFPCKCSIYDPLALQTFTLYHI